MKMPESQSGQTHAALFPEYFEKTATKGAFYVEFDVPVSAVRIHPNGGGKVNIIGPNSVDARLGIKDGQPVPEMPKIINIRKVKVKE